MRPQAATRLFVLAGAVATARPAAARPGVWSLDLAPGSTADDAAAVEPARAAEAKQPLTAALKLTSGATCLTPGALVEHIRTWLGSDAIDAGVAIEVRGDPRRSDAATIVLRTRDGGIIERTFEDSPPGCSDMHAVIGLGVAMAIDASVLVGLGYDVIESPEAAALPAPPQAVDSERPPMLVRREPEPPPPRRRVRVVMAARGSVWLGSLPGVTGGGQLQLELGWRDLFELRLGALGGYAAGRPLADGRVDVGLVAARVDGCFGLTRKRLRPRMCLGPAVGALQATGRVFPTASHATTPWVAAALALELRIAASKIFSVDVVVDALVPFVRPVVAVRDPAKPGMIGESVNFAPLGVMLGLGGAFTIR